MRSGFGSSKRTVHVNLAELNLPALGDESWPPKPFEFSAETVFVLSRHLPKRAVKDLKLLCYSLRRYPPWLGQDSKANAPNKVRRQLEALCNLSDAMCTVLMHLRWGHAGAVLAQRRFWESHDAGSVTKFSEGVHSFRSLVTEVLRDAEEYEAQRPKAYGRQPSAPVLAAAWVAAIVAAHKVPISASPEAPFMDICTQLWRDLGVANGPTHSVRLLIRALKRGGVNVMAFGSYRHRAYRLAPDPDSELGYRASVIQDWRDEPEYRQRRG